jgi:hypothetical protein
MARKILTEEEKKSISSSYFEDFEHAGDIKQLEKCTHPHGHVWNTTFSISDDYNSSHEFGRALRDMGEEEFKVCKHCSYLLIPQFIDFDNPINYISSKILIRLEDPEDPYEIYQLEGAGDIEEEGELMSESIISNINLKNTRIYKEILQGKRVFELNTIVSEPINLAERTLTSGDYRTNRIISILKVKQVYPLLKYIVGELSKKDT